MPHNTCVKGGVVCTSQVSCTRTHQHAEPGFEPQIFWVKETLLSTEPQSPNITGTIYSALAKLLPRVWLSGLCILLGICCTWISPCWRTGVNWEARPQNNKWCIFISLLCDSIRLCVLMFQMSLLRCFWSFLESISFCSVRKQAMTPCWGPWEEISLNSLEIWMLFTVTWLCPIRFAHVCDYYR